MGSTPKQIQFQGRHFSFFMGATPENSDDLF